MLCRDQRDHDIRRDTDRLPPVVFFHIGNARSPDEGEVAERHDGSRRMLFGETAQCGEIEMIVMVMRHEHDIDGGQFLKANARVAVPLGACPGNRAA